MTTQGKHTPLTAEELAELRRTYEPGVVAPGLSKRREHINRLLDTTDHMLAENERLREALALTVDRLHVVIETDTDSGRDPSPDDVKAWEVARAALGDK